MAGMICEASSLNPGLEEADYRREDSIAYEHISYVAPEILEALEGRLAIDVGEIAACFDFYKPFYPKSVGDLLDYADRSSIGNPSFTGSVNLPKPLYLEDCDTFIFSVEKFVNTRALSDTTKEELADFIDRERKSFFSPAKKRNVPLGYELCYCVVILNKLGTSTIALASIAKRKHI